MDQNTLSYQVPEGGGKTFDYRVGRAADFSVRARVNLDIFSYLSFKSNIEKFGDIIEDFYSLFEFIRSANEHDFLSRIVNLFTHRKDTNNFPELVREAKSSGAIDPKICEAITSHIELAKPAFEDAKKIRNKVVGHQDKSCSKPEIYKIVKPTLNKFIALSNQSFLVANMLCDARGLEKRVILSRPLEELEKMLTVLQRGK